jgi:hypothetical protein
MRCPSCNSRQPLLSPWRALASESVRCPSCGTALVLKKSKSTVHLHFVIGSIIASVFSGMLLMGTDTLGTALLVFLAMEGCLIAYTYLVLFQWRPDHG